MDLWDSDKFLYNYKKNPKGALITVSNNNRLVVKHFMSLSTVTYKYDEVTQFLESNPIKAGKIVFEDCKTHDAIEKYHHLGYKVAALNFANSFTPGGGYLRGSHTQEEELCRQFPHLYASLISSQLYPIKQGTVLITPGIKRVREGIENGYKLISEPTTEVCFITAAAPDLNEHHKESIPTSTFANHRETINTTMKLVMTSSKTIADYNVLILGAWGCGAFAPRNIYKRNSHINQMANEIKKVCSHYRYLYDIIIFAIPDKSSENYKIFSSVFKSMI